MDRRVVGRRRTGDGVALRADARRPLAAPGPRGRRAAGTGERCADLDFSWPSISVVICAYNAASTLDECLRHTCALDYPGLEVIVVDDGSTDATADIAQRYPRVRLVQIEHAGLAAARNAGLEAATGELVAYLDSDAFRARSGPTTWRSPSTARRRRRRRPEYPAGRRAERRAGGRPRAGRARPRAVLRRSCRARPRLQHGLLATGLSEIGGFDPVYTSAGDDVDVCWKVLNRDWKIGFHPAALVWHHRRQGLRNYLRQQREYGRSETLVEARHPERFTPAGTARWRGRIYNSLTPSFSGSGSTVAPTGPPRTSPSTAAEATTSTWSTRSASPSPSCCC